MGTHVVTMRPMHNTYISTLSANIGVKGIASGVDRVNDLLPCPSPTAAAKVRDTLVGIVARLLVYAGYTNIRHVLTFLLRFLCAKRRRSLGTRQIIAHICLRKGIWE